MSTTPGRAVMRAAQYDGYGPPAMLQVRTVPIPRLRSGHLMVRFAATSVNAADITIRKGIRQGPSGGAANYVLAPVSAVAAAPRSIDVVSAVHRVAVTRHQCSSTIAAHSE